MDDPRQDRSPEADVVALIEQALVTVRRDSSRHRPPGPGGDSGGSGPHAHHGGPHGYGTRGLWPSGRGRPDGAETGVGEERPVAFGDSARGGPRGRGGRDGSLGRVARVRMLEALAHAEVAGHDLSISALAAAIGVDQPRASRLVQDGVENGLVRRVPDPSDARRVRIQLTASGRTQLGEVRSHRRSAVEAALADFTPEEARTFAALFDRFVRAWPRP